MPSKYTCSTLNIFVTIMGKYKSILEVICTILKIILDLNNYLCQIMFQIITKASYKNKIQ